MSHGLYLVCHETRQIVHVSESSSGWFGGADSSLVAAAFCDAHAFRHQLVVLGEEWDYHVHRSEYTEWTLNNVEEQYRIVAGYESASTATAITDAIRKAKQDNFAQGYFYAVASALEKHGATPWVRELFAQGGDPTNASAWCIELFREHGLMPEDSTKKR